MTDKQRVLVTGATGLVGESVVGRLTKNPALEVIAMGGRKGSNFIEDGAKLDAYWSGDIADEKTIESFYGKGKIDCLVHAAGLAHQFGPVSREDFMRVNVRGTENICRLAAALEAKRLVLISSVSVYGDHGAALIDENFSCRPEGDYAESKFQAELAARELCRRHGLELTTLRLSTVVGEKDRGNVKRLITKVVDGKFFWVGEGRNKKSLIDKRDVAAAIEMVVTDDRKACGIYNVTQEPIEMRQIVNAIADAAGRKIPHWSIPASWAGAIGRLNTKTVKLPQIEAVSKTLGKWLSDDLFSNRKFFERYGFRPPTKIETAIEREVKHFLSEEFRKAST